MNKEEQLFQSMKQAFVKKTSRCRYDNQIYLYNLGKLGGEGQRQIELHLAFCRRCLRIYRRSKLFGFIWNDVTNTVRNGEREIKKNFNFLREHFNQAAHGWQPAMVRVSGTTKPVIVEAALLDSDYQLTGENVKLKIIKVPVITEDGRFVAGLTLQNRSFNGRVLSLTLLNKDEKLVTLTSKLKINDEKQGLEANFSEKRFDLPASMIPLNKIRLNIWAEEKWDK